MTASKNAISRFAGIFALVLFGALLFALSGENLLYAAPKPKSDGSSPKKEEALTKEHEELLAKLSEKYKGLSALKAEYRRKTITPATDPIFKNQAIQEASGTLYWKKAYSIKLEQAKPQKEELLTNGSVAWWYLPKEKAVHVYRGLDFSGEFYPLAAFLDGLDELKKHFRISKAPEASERPGEYGFLLTPEKEGSYGSITAYCDENATLTGFRLSSATGEQTDFVLIDPAINPNLKDSFFVWKAKRGVRMVEENMDEGF
jgi:outer membrane lipoprotein-sorting protein